MKLSKDTKILLIILAIALLLRVIFPAINPPAWSTDDYGLLADEGYKTLSAKNLVLFGETHPNKYDSYPGWVTLSPVSHFLFTAVFTLFGTGYVQARLINIIFSFVSICLVYLISQKFLPKKTALLATFFLAINISYLIYNKIALLESLLVFFLLCSVYFWTLARTNKLYIVLSVFFFGLSFLVKPLAVIFVPVLVFMMYDVFKKNISKKQIFTYSGILIILGIVGIVLFPQIIAIIINFSATRHPDSLKMFIVLLRQFWYQDFFLLNTLLLGFFLGYIVQFVHKFISKKNISSFEILMLVWVFGGFGLLVLQTYRPPRYFVTIIPPLVILAAIFLSQRVKLPRNWLSKGLIGVSTSIILMNLYYYSKQLLISPFIYLGFALVILICAIILIPRIVFTPQLRKYLVILYVVFNLVLVGAWFVAQDYSLVETSKDIGSIVGPDDVLLGVNWAPALCLDNSVECYHVSGEGSEAVSAFRNLNVTYFLTDSFVQLEVDKVPFYNVSTFNQSLTYLKTYSIGRFNIFLYKFDQDTYYSFN